MISALIPAAGLGLRLGLGPKLFLEAGGRPLIRRLLAQLQGQVDQIVIAVPPAHLAAATSLLKGVEDGELPLDIIAGGQTRQESVEQLVAAARHPWVLLHDAARPLVSARLIEQVIAAGRNRGAAAAILPCDVPLARLAAGHISEHLPAAAFGLFQSPQFFPRNLLQHVLAEASAAGLQRQSTLQLWLDAGHPVQAVAGEKTNFKLTDPADWQLLTALLPLLDP